MSEIAIIKLNLCCFEIDYAWQNLIKTNNHAVLECV